MWVIVRGGLGNQMFQAAFALSVAKQFDVVPRFVDLTRSARVHRNWDLDCFALHRATVTPASSRFLSACVVATRKLQSLGLPAIPGVLVEQVSSPALYVRARPSVISGYWQNVQYIERNEQLIRKTFDLSLITSRVSTSATIDTRPKVAIHVRRGDYVSDAKSRKVHLVCDAGWYRRAWSLMRDEVPDARAFVFSDDPTWAQTSLNLAGEVTYMPFDAREPAVRDMALMSGCHHFIISNSSYSWWSAWLSQSPNKKVIAPREWFIGTATAGLGICPESWRLI
jgi:hypothetical protein